MFISQKVELNLSCFLRYIGNNGKKYSIDTVSLGFPKKGREVANYIKDGMIEDWDMLEQVLDYAYDKVIKSESEMHPVLISEAPWNQRYI